MRPGKGQREGKENSKLFEHTIGCGIVFWRGMCVSCFQCNKETAANNPPINLSCRLWLKGVRWSANEQCP